MNENKGEQTAGTWKCARDTGGVNRKATKCKRLYKHARRTAKAREGGGCSSADGGESARKAWNNPTFPTSLAQVCTRISPGSNQRPSP